MLCCTCHEDIPPSFKNCFINNVCPACGGPIMNEAMKEFLDSLKTALESMPGDPDGIASWLLSNYEMRKIGTGEPVQRFLGTPKAFAGTPAPADGSPIKVNSNNKLQQFLERTKKTGVKSPEQYAAIMSQFSSEDPIAPVQREDPIEEANDPEYTSKMLAAMSETSITEKARNSGKIKLPPAQQAVIESLVGGGPKKPGFDITKSDDLPPALRADRMDRIQKQQDLDIMGSVGKIKRSG